MQFKFLRDWGPVQSFRKQTPPPAHSPKSSLANADGISYALCENLWSNCIITSYSKWSLKATDMHIAILPLIFYLYSCPLVRSNIPSDLWPKLFEQFKQIFWLQSINTEHSVPIKGWKSCLWVTVVTSWLYYIMSGLEGYTNLTYYWIYCLLFQCLRKNS